MFRNGGSGLFGAAMMVDLEPDLAGQAADLFVLETTTRASRCTAQKSWFSTYKPCARENRTGDAHRTKWRRRASSRRDVEGRTRCA
jgi:hypothetical protein